MIQELEKGGAESIIPPILQHPPRFELADDDEWENMDAVEGGEEVEAAEEGAVGDDEGTPGAVFSAVATAPFSR